MDFSLYFDDGFSNLLIKYQILAMFFQNDYIIFIENVINRDSFIDNAFRSNGSMLEQYFKRKRLYVKIFKITLYILEFV